MNKNILRIVVFGMVSVTLIGITTIVLGGMITETRNSKIVKKVNDIDRLSSSKMELGEGLAEKSTTEYTENSNEQNQNKDEHPDAADSKNNDIPNGKIGSMYEIEMSSYKEVKPEDKEKFKQSFNLPDSANVIKVNNCACVFRWRHFEIEYILPEGNKDETVRLFANIEKIVWGIDSQAGWIKSQADKGKYTPMTVLYVYNSKEALEKYGGNVVYINVCLDNIEYNIVIDPETFTEIERRSSVDIDRRGTYDSEEQWKSGEYEKYNNNQKEN